MTRSFQSAGTSGFGWYWNRTYGSESARKNVPFGISAFPSLRSVFICPVPSVGWTPFCTFQVQNGHPFSLQAY